MLSGIGSQIPLACLFPSGLGAFPFWSWVVGELCLFSFGLGELSLFPSPHPPQTSYPTLVGLIGTIRYYRFFLVFVCLFVVVFRVFVMLYARFFDQSGRQATISCDMCVFRFLSSVVDTACMIA